MDLIFLVAGAIEGVSGLVCLLEPEAMFPGVTEPLGRLAARVWAASVLSFGAAVYFGWRDHHTQSSSRRGLMIGVVLYNAILSGMFAESLVTGAPIMGVHPDLPPTLQLVARGLGFTTHLVMFGWSLLWLNESGKLAPDHVYISNLAPQPATTPAAKPATASAAPKRD